MTVAVGARKLFKVDAGVVHALLNARYYNSAQGQFTSEDPIFVSLGTANAEQLAGTNLRTILSDPQSLNSYSYSNDNPITNMDPSGKYFQAAYSNIIPLPFIPVIGDFAGISYTLGARGDSHGISIFGNVGFALGYGKKFSLSYSPGDSPQPGATINAGYDVATPYGGLGHSLSGSFFPNVTSLSQPWSIEVGESIDEYVSVEAASPTLLSFPSLNNRTSTQTTSLSTQVSPQTSVNRTSSQYAIAGASYTSSGQIATFTTPSGAVVTWGGQLISGPPARK
jgi:RHS repeat-associated protein